MKLSINKKIIDKNVNGIKDQAWGFEPYDLTPEQLAECITQGFACSYQFQKSHRKADNFICSDIIAADIDEKMNFDEALNDQYLKENACILYTTPRHTEELHRLRLIFQLPRTITDRDELRAAQQGLTRMFPADKAAVDPARQFYGHKGCKLHLFGQVLSEQNLQKLIELGREPKNQTDRVDRPRIAGTRSTLSIDADTQVKTSRNEWRALDELEPSKSVYCPFHHDKKPSAFTTESRSGTKGIHCSSCQQTFWLSNITPEPYDFFLFDRLANEAYAHGASVTVTDPTGMLEYEEPNPNRVMAEQYLQVDDVSIVDGITLIKSPKGSGKTHYLKEVVDHFKQRGNSILLIGHRRLLLQELASRLELEYYEDASPSKHYAVSVDSLATKTDPAINKYDVVLIDESEQVLSHLIADTIDPDKRKICYLRLQYYVSVAKHVVALDADLNQITMHAMQRFGNKNPLIDRRLILNEYKAESRRLEVYVSRNHLLGSMMDSLSAGDRIFVACNSKVEVEELVSAIYHMFGSDFPIFSITSDNSSQDEVKYFIKNIKSEILKYKALIVSPAMASGIDITFPDGVSHVDGVYGIFQAKINTHFEVDQQISRVRNPKYIRVWVNPAKFEFEYEVDPIKQELAESRIVPESLQGYTIKGLPEYNWSDPYLTLYATILSAQRASKNKLCDNFIELRQHNGWEVVTIEADSHLAADGKEVKNLGATIREDEYVRNILNARRITAEEADELKAKSSKATGAINVEENSSLNRFFIETFYRMGVTEELIRKDDEGKYRERIRTMEGLLVPSFARKGNQRLKLLHDLLHAAKLIDDQNSWDIDQAITKESLHEFSSLCKKSKPKIERVFDVEVGRDVTSNPVAQLNRFLKLCGLKAVKVAQHSKGDQKITEYRINPDTFNEIMALIAHRENTTTDSLQAYDVP
jgi:hypothetical protein